MSDQTWTVRRILSWMEGYLGDHGDANPRASAQWLVADALDTTAIQLYADFDRPLTLDERDVLRGYTKRRAQGEPLQYITGSCGFRFITVAIEPGVLIPRPETEVLVSEALGALDQTHPTRSIAALSHVEAAMSDALRIAFGEGGTFDAQALCDQLIVALGDGYDVDDVRAVIDRSVVMSDAGQPVALDLESAASSIASLREESPIVVDLCTGSGNIACSIASERPRTHVIATDLDQGAVSLAKRNVAALGLEGRVDVLQGDLGDALPPQVYGSIALIVSNPPYIPTEVLKTLDAEVTEFEPALALDGGNDGLDVFRRIVDFAYNALDERGVLAVELHETCLDEASLIARAAGFAQTRTVCDRAGRPRVLMAYRTSL